jgi:hypothetical protein
MDDLRSRIFDIVSTFGYPSDEVADHMHEEAARWATDKIMELIYERINEERHYAERERE